MIPVNHAVSVAVTFLDQMFGKEIANVRLEEVDLSDDGLWHVTLSFVRRSVPENTTTTPESSVIRDLRDEVKPREYKVIAISAEDGKFRSMKIRQLV
jgi:hypothetical protein